MCRSQVFRCHIAHQVSELVRVVKRPSLDRIRSKVLISLFRYLSTSSRYRHFGKGTLHIHRNSRVLARFQFGLENLSLVDFGQSGHLAVIGRTRSTPGHTVHGRIAHEEAGLAAVSPQSVFAQILGQLTDFLESFLVEIRAGRIALTGQQPVVVQHDHGIIIGRLLPFSRRRHQNILHDVGRRSNLGLVVFREGTDIQVIHPVQRCSSLRLTGEHQQFGTVHLVLIRRPVVVARCTLHAHSRRQVNEESLFAGLYHHRTILATVAHDHVVAGACAK